MQPAVNWRISLQTELPLNLIFCFKRIKLHCTAEVYLKNNTTMKKFIAIASAVILFAGAAQAQDSTKHRRQHDHAVKGGHQFSNEIGLTEAQKAEFKTQNEAFRTQAKAIRDNSALSQEQKKTQLELYASNSMKKCRMF
jgi:hypothetical protein